jgi:hypothetical protein
MPELHLPDPSQWGQWDFLFGASMVACFAMYMDVLAWIHEHALRDP